MAINVTPIPKLSDFAVPTISFGTAAAGTATTVIRSDATIAGVAGAGTVVDESITRFNGTTGFSLQGYSSLSPTISDAGILTLTSGALAFPATAIASTDPNTLDDYQEGVWQPELWDSSASSSESQGYAVQVGFFTRIGNRVFYNFNLQMSSLGSLTTAEPALIGGLPFTSSAAANSHGGGNSIYHYYLNLAGGSGQVTMFVSPNAASLNLYQNTATNADPVTVGEFSADGVLFGTGQYLV